jgi:CMP-N,N'-diacetyllegionaminic acid synthase
MKHKLRRICTICARAGSKGVKNKNVRELHGKPLIAHSIAQANASEMFDVIAISSDSKRILDVAGQWGSNHSIMRPSALASDTASKIPAIRHCVEQVERTTNSSFDIVVDLDVTAPLRTVKDIRGAINLLEKNRASNVITGVPARKSPYFNQVEVAQDGVVRLVKAPASTIWRRQDSPRCFDMNASVYAWQRKALFKFDHIFNMDTLLYVMPAERSIDIDSELDFEMVEFIGRKLGLFKAGSPRKVNV